jgi:glycosyltransferase involved in cell wall biosynthesis
VELKGIKEKKKKIFTIGASGDFAYAPNREGLLWFYKNVWKKYFYFDKSIRLVIAGKNSVKLKTCIKGENVEILGEVLDLDKEISSWDAGVVPVFYGAGRQNKILQLWANRVPVIASGFSVKGVYGRAEKNLLAADTPQEFCEKILFIKRDLGERKVLSNEGLKTVKKHFTWDRSGVLFEKIIKRECR